MPWKVYGQCVHKLNKDGSRGELVKCHESSAKAKAHMRALYANVDDVVEKMIIELAGEEPAALVKVTKEDGRYKLTTVSTAAIVDQENETFTTEAIDYDIAHAKSTGKYPEFRVFHSPLLGIGRVTHMKRVGIFAVDEGYSYTDDFSLSVCEKMLADNDGKWRVSRGFMAVGVSANCPHCSSLLGITQKHMVIGFTCPVCANVRLSFKGMPNVQYKKAITFDVTITDVPAVPMTSAAAFRISDDSEEIMTKEQLKERLLAAGLDESVVDARLSSITSDQLKELDNVPVAQVLKEFGVDEQEGTEFFMDESVLDDIADRVSVRVKSLFESMEIELELDGEAQTKEIDLSGVLQEVAELKELVTMLLQSDEERLKELNTPNSRNRLRIFKGGGKMKPKNMSMEDEEDEEDEEEGEQVSKQTARWLRDFQAQPASGGDVIQDAAGNSYSSLSEFVGAGG